jgi:hypothetical protein
VTKPLRAKAKPSHPKRSQRAPADLEGIMQRIRELSVSDRASLAVGLVGQLATDLDGERVSALEAELHRELQGSREREREGVREREPGVWQVDGERDGGGTRRAGWGASSRKPGVGQAGRGEYQPDEPL